MSKFVYGCRSSGEWVLRLIRRLLRVFRRNFTRELWSVPLKCASTALRPPQDVCLNRHEHDPALLDLGHLHLGSRMRTPFCSVSPFLTVCQRICGRPGCEFSKIWSPAAYLRFHVSGCDLLTLHSKLPSKINVLVQGCCLTCVRFWYSDQKQIEKSIGTEFSSKGAKSTFLH